jgi:hypothetical protein
MTLRIMTVLTILCTMTLGIMIISKMTFLTILCIMAINMMLSIKTLLTTFSYDTLLNFNIIM